MSSPPFTGIETRRWWLRWADSLDWNRPRRKFWCYRIDWDRRTVRLWDRELGLDRASSVWLTRFTGDGRASGVIELIVDGCVLRNYASKRFEAAKDLAQALADELRVELIETN